MRPVTFNRGKALNYICEKVAKSEHYKRAVYRTISQPKCSVFHEECAFECNSLMNICPKRRELPVREEISFAALCDLQLGARTMRR